MGWEAVCTETRALKRKGFAWLMLKASYARYVEPPGGL